MNSLPPTCDPERIVHPDTHFDKTRSGWYRLWYKTLTGPGWCAQRVPAHLAKQRYDRMLAAGQLRNFLIEQIPFHTPAYRAGNTHVPMKYSYRERQFLTRRGIG